MATETASTKSSAAAGAAAPAAAAAATQEPIIIDLGKKKRKLVRKLRKGKPNRLMDRIMEVLDDGRAAKAIPSDAQPVVIIVREKKRAKIGKMWGLG
ncbi:MULTISPECIES: hypothetical protein [unclassified Polyangium]|uniref:DUF6200 domain-containing protein n=1 Tax=unclassified Polyangium (in: bacteria) TaxID=3407073 RepID=UPI002482F315|nr:MULTISPECIES: hypothetical protein [unclassified Polyangium]MDI1475033.1 hypothetical protein [Polyangium sp. y55x31]MDI3284219.1 hypothetical protein [Polyangium sp. 15x6]